MSRYLVTLKPLGCFFFGGERTFGINENEKNNIIKSMYFPQQTSILGMIRKELLVKSGLIREDIFSYKDDEKNKMDKLIGKESFILNKDNQSFGCIKNISPVFIKLRDNEEYLMNIPMDYDMKDGSNLYKPLSFMENACRCSYSDEEIYLPKDFKSKMGISNDFINASGEIKNRDESFKEESNIGIKINKNGVTEDECLFRIIRYRLDNADFVFNVDIDNVYIDNVDINEKLDKYKNVVTLGGEGSYFQICFEKASENIIDKFKVRSSDNCPYKKIVLLSDTYIGNGKSYDENCLYSIANTVSFRNLRVSKQNKKYYKSFKKSEVKYTFLERGSVLYTTSDKYEKLKQSIDNLNLQQIGYNTFIEGE